MSKKDKLLNNISNNPKGDYTIEQLKTMANRYDIIFREGKGSHCVFTHPQWEEMLTIPNHRPIKPIYIKRFVELIKQLENSYE